MVGLNTEPDEAAEDEHLESEYDHVPSLAATVVHEIKGGGDVRVTVVAEQIVHPRPVDVGGLGHTAVPARSATYVGNRLLTPLRPMTRSGYPRL